MKVNYIYVEGKHIATNSCPKHFWMVKWNGDIWNAIELQGELATTLHFDSVWPYYDYWPCTVDVMSPLTLINEAVNEDLYIELVTGH